MPLGQLMQILTRDDLMTLEDYAANRAEFRQRVIAHKKNRTVAIGDHVSLHFEDRLTMHYQVQEMLRIEKIFEADAIDEELGTYNPLIPDGSNWKATMMIEYADAVERHAALAILLGIEDRVWVAVGDADRGYAVADEDMDRATPEKTSAVHFLRFELSTSMMDAIKSGSSLSLGIDHPEYTQCIDPAPGSLQDALVEDLD